MLKGQRTFADMAWSTSHGQSSIGILYASLLRHDAWRKLTAYCSAPAAMCCNTFLSLRLKLVLQKSRKLQLRETPESRHVALHTPE